MTTYRGVLGENLYEAFIPAKFQWAYFDFSLCAILLVNGMSCKMKWALLREIE